MKDSKNVFDEQEVIILIKSLQMEKERYKQEKLVEKIGNIRDERTAELVAGLLYSEDTYIRNTAIELFIALSEKALQVLSEKISDPDRNIRKFALDALKHIKVKRSCEIALAALDDPDENVVEAALEVIAEQSYQEATGKLLKMLDEVNSIWILNALLRTFEKLGVKKLSEAISRKIFSINASAIEKNILINTYVKALGRIGSQDDIDLVLNKYVKEFSIDESNLVFGLCGLIVNNKINSLPEKTALELERIFKESWNYKDSDQLFVSMTAFIQLRMDFFLDDIKEIYSFYKGEEFFLEFVYELLQKHDRFPDGFIFGILTSEEPELIMMGLKLIHKQQLPGFNSIVENLCYSKDRDISELAASIIRDIQLYKNNSIIEGLTEYSVKDELSLVENEGFLQSNNVDLLFLKLNHHNPKIRKAVAQKLALGCEVKNIELLEEIIRNNPGEEGLEALEVLFRLNADTGRKHITSRMDCMNENVRSGLIDIMEYSSDDDFYSFMNTMINDPSPKVRKKAIKAMGKRIDDRSLQFLKKLYSNECDALNRMEIISNMYKFRNDDAFKMLIEAGTSSDVLTRIAAVRSLGFFDTVTAKIALESMIDDPVEEVREAVKDALSRAEVME